MHTRTLFLSLSQASPFNKSQGGPEIVQAVAGGKSTLMYTSSDTRIIVKSLGFLPISRMYHAECTILKEWSPGGRVLSDCWGRFV